MTNRLTDAVPYSRVILISGIRGNLLGSNEEKISSKILEQVGSYPVDKTLLVHGGAVGVDRFVGKWGAEKDFQVREMPYLSEYGSAGGYYRNMEMVALVLGLKFFGVPVTLCAFPAKDKTGGGTRHCIEFANCAGIETVVTELRIFSAQIKNRKRRT